jgi:hypothetical protein
MTFAGIGQEVFLILNISAPGKPEVPSVLANLIYRKPACLLDSLEGLGSCIFIGKKAHQCKRSYLVYLSGEPLNLCLYLSRAAPILGNVSNRDDCTITVDPSTIATSSIVQGRSTTELPQPKKMGAVR